MQIVLGVGVCLSAVSVFVFQGAIALLAGIIEPLLASVPGSIEQVACVGSVMIIAIGMNLIGITKIKVANFLPGIIIAPIAMWVSNLLSTVL